MEQSVVIAAGMDARKIALFVQAASNYNCKISLRKQDPQDESSKALHEANGKSIMGLIALGMTEGQSYLLCLSGENEQEAAEELRAILET